MDTSYWFRFPVLVTGNLLLIPFLLIPIYFLNFFSLPHHSELLTAASVSPLHFSCASTMATKAIFTMFRTVLPSCNTCTGFFIPNKMGPIASAPPILCALIPLFLLSFYRGSVGQQQSVYWHFLLLIAIKPDKIQTLECPLKPYKYAYPQEKVAMR